MRESLGTGRALLDFFDVFSVQITDFGSTSFAEPRIFRTEANNAQSRPAFVPFSMFGASSFLKPHTDLHENTRFGTTAKMPSTF